MHIITHIGTIHIIIHIHIRIHTDTTILTTTPMALIGGNKWLWNDDVASEALLDICSIRFLLPLTLLPHCQIAFEPTSLNFTT
jgi:hypothetical protein